MGISCDARLSYGIVIDWDKGKLEELIEENPRFKKFVDDSGNPDPWELAGYIENEFDCYIECACNEEAYRLLVIPQSGEFADYGVPEKVESLDVDPEWDIRLKKAMDFLGLEWEEPAWWLTSIMG